MQTEQKRNGKAVLLVAYRFPPENTSGALRPFRFATYLPRYGYSTWVISRRLAGLVRSGRVIRVPTASDAAVRLRLVEGMARGIQRLLPYNDELPWVPHALSAARKLTRRVGVRAVLSTGPPIATHFVALWLKKAAGIRWIADFRDPLWGNPFRNRTFGRCYDASAEKWIFRNADALIGNTETAVSLWQKRYPAWSHKMHVLMNGFDPAETVSALALPPRRELVITHAGSLYGGRRPGKFLGSIQRLVVRRLLDPDGFRIQFIGPIENFTDVAQRPPFSTLIAKGCLKCDARRVSLQSVRKAMGESDFLLVFDQNDAETALQLPAKIFDYIRIGRPILGFTSRGSPLEMVLANSGVLNKIIYGDDPEEHIDRQVLALLRLPTKPVDANPWFWRNFDVRLQTQWLASLLDRLV